MDDLISRKAAIEAVKKLLYETAFNSCGHHQDDEIYADIADNRIEVWLGLVPAVHAVPLDKLATWIVENLDPRCDCNYCFNESTDFEDRECCNCPKMSEEQVKEALTKLMEEQNESN